MAGRALLAEVEYWQNNCGRYRDLFTELTTQANVPLLQTLGVKRKTKFLDVACGHGQLAGAAQAQGAVATGLDFSSEMIRHAREMFPRVKFDLGRAESLPYKSESVDAVAINFGIFHFADEFAALAEAYRVLKPGGRLAFTVWETGGSRQTGFNVLLRTVAGTPGAGRLRMPSGNKMLSLSRPSASLAIMSFARFRQVQAHSLDLAWELRNADQFYQAFFGNVENTENHSAEFLELLLHLRKVLRQSVEMNFSNGDEILIPMPALLFSGVK